VAQKRIAVVGYGTIGERIADAIFAQDDMELTGVVDVAASLPIRALSESDRDYPIFCGREENVADMKQAGVKLAGTIDDLLPDVNAVIDACSPGIGLKNRDIYQKYGVPAIFQAGEKLGIGQNMFYPMANYRQCQGLKYLQMLSCNTTGIARQIFVCHRALEVQEAICMIIRRSADISETHKGPVDALLPVAIPSHQCEDFSYVSPDIKVVTAVVTAPVCHGHATTMIFDVKKKTTKQDVVDMFVAEPRIRIFKLADGFISTSHIFDYNRDRGAPRGDMYEVPVWDETIYIDHDGTRIYSINMIPQEAIVIPENIDALRCILGTEDTGDEAMAHTNRCLGIK